MHGVLTDTSTIPPPMPPRPRPTFDDLCRRQPMLRQLWWAARNQPRVRGRGILEIWYGSYKPQLVGLVGWQCLTADPVLGTCDAYDVAYDTILTALEKPRKRSTRR